MKVITTFILWMLVAGAVAAQDKKAYTLLDAKGKEVRYSDMMKKLGEQDVVFFGEIHNCPIAHWMEYEVVRDLYDRHKEQLMIGAEMFEADNQLVLDEYLGGVISADRFKNELKMWPNYATDYAKVVEFAKKNGIPFVATNVPRRYANIVSKGGFAVLDSLSDEARKYIAPRLPVCAEQAGGRLFQFHEDAGHEGGYHRKPFPLAGGEGCHDGVVYRQT